MILVVGSTGYVGSMITRQLAESAKPVAGLVRDESSDKAKALASAGAKLRTGDLKDRPSLLKAMEGVDTVICTASSTMSRQEGDGIESVDQRGIQTLIDVAEEKGVKRFVFVSYSHNMGDDSPLSKGKRAAEARLARSKMACTILLPSFFPETWFSAAVGFDVQNGKIRVYGDGNAKVSYITGADVARAAVASVDNPKAVGKSLPIGGPAISQLEAVALAEKATGRKMQVEHMSIDQIQKARAETTEPIMASFLSLFEALARGDDLPMSWTEALDMKPQSAESWLSKSLKA